MERMLNRPDIEDLDDIAKLLHAVVSICICKFIPVYTYLEKGGSLHE